MDNQFPQMLYKAGGPEQIHGGNFSTLIVEDSEQFDAALADRWAERTDSAVELRDQAIAASKVAVASESTADSNKAPTREELEQKATQLGIEFSARVSDKKLRDLIAATLES